MKLETDILRISHEALDEDGRKLEPEAQPIVRVLSGIAPVELQYAGAVGNLPVEVETTTTAEQIGGSVRSWCWRCVHFDRAAWSELRAHMERGSMDQRQALNALRYALLTTGNAALQEMSPAMEGDTDAEHALSICGICRPISEIQKDPVIVHPLSSCPEVFRTPGSPAGLFSPRDREHERNGSAAFDTIMRAAAGGTP